MNFLLFNKFSLIVLGFFLVLSLILNKIYWSVNLMELLQ